MQMTEQPDPRMAEIQARLERAGDLCREEDAAFARTYTREQPTREALRTAIAAMQFAEAQLTALTRERDEWKEAAEQAVKAGLDLTRQLKQTEAIADRAEQAEAALASERERRTAAQEAITQRWEPKLVEAEAETLRLREVIAQAAIPLEALRTTECGRLGALSMSMQSVIVNATNMIRAALQPSGETQP